MNTAKQHSGCSRATSIDQLCPTCLAEWERWMEETAMPQLRQAVTRVEAASGQEGRHAA